MLSKREILTFARYYKKKLNKKVFKVPISISGFTCPNIDGTVAKGGCIFCLNDSFSPNINKSRDKILINSFSKTNPLLQNQLHELKTQFFTTKNSLKKIKKAQKFIVYFQSFTNTYAPLDTLKELYLKALSFKDVIGISIGTRADCVNDEVLQFLKELSKSHEIWVEYGIQSIHDNTLQKINRGEKFENIEKIIQKTKEYGLKVCTHLIFGLPDESDEMIVETVKKVVSLNIDSIKIHPCYVVKNTLLANDLKIKKYQPIDFNRYLNLVEESIKLIPKHVIVQRLTAGIDDDTLLAPTWCKTKNFQLNKIRDRLLLNNVIY
ncbi:MAG: TIGR01212 family radical SAM protein [Campylobacterales bacterium]|nr:TIGR01212 family radical SAM protein [Campylobacterales bacterium]